MSVLDGVSLVLVCVLVVVDLAMDARSECSTEPLPPGCLVRITTTGLDGVVTVEHVYSQRDAESPL